MLKEEIVLKSFAEIVVIHGSKQFHSPDGAKNVNLISLETKSSNSSKSFGAGRGAKKLKKMIKIQPIHL